MAVCDIFQMLFSYTEMLHVHKPTFLGTTLTNQNYMHETIKSRLNAGLSVCVCVCVRMKLFLEQYAHTAY